MRVIEPHAIPNYSEHAAVEFRLLVKQWRVSAETVIQSFDNVKALQHLLEQTLSVSRTGQALGYSALRFGLVEVEALLRHWQKQPPTDRSESALLLLQIGEEMDNGVALSAVQARRASALSWVSVIDNCRASRQVPAVSKDVVAAAGIALPAKSNKPMAARSDCEDFLAVIRGVHKVYVHALSRWLRHSNNTDHLSSLSTTFIKVAEACDTPSRLSMLEPLFRAAGVVLQAVVNDSALSSMAVQRLFGQLERYLAQLGRLEFDSLIAKPNLLPDDILRQLLFYVAQFPNRSPHADRLRREYGLDVLAVTTQRIGDKRRINTELSEQVLAQIGRELDELQTWLSQAAVDPAHKRAKQLFVRLEEQRVACSLLGFNDLERSIGLLRRCVADMSTPVTESQKMNVATQILRVRETLATPILSTDQDVAASGLAIASVDDVASRLKQLSRQDGRDQFQAAASVACLQAVQGELRRAESDVLALLNNQPLINASPDEIAQRLKRSALALSILPVPELVPLLNELSEFVRTKVDADTDHTDRSNLAELIVAMDLYLDSVVADSCSLTPMLQHAVESLNLLTGGDPSTDAALLAASSLGPNTDTLEPPADVLDVYLSANLTIAPWINGKSSDRTEVSNALAELANAAEENQLFELSTLVSDCKRYTQQEPVPGDARDLVRETLAVVPQMLHAEPGVVESVRGLNTLQQRLANFDAENDLPDNTANFNADDDPLDNTANSNAEDDLLDNTLQTVFVRECATHIATLRKAIRVARADIPLSKLPSENMLRALHTLSGCTQTVDATDIVAIVNPLQKSALRLQRAGENFTDAETDYIERLALAMEARLVSFEHRGDVDESVRAIEAELPNFVDQVSARLQPDSADTGSQDSAKVTSWLIAKSNTVEKNEAGLSSIFRAEADDLMMQLRTHTANVLSATSNDSVDSAHNGASDREGVLRVLHTIKGSARMAGNHVMADAAHELESDVAGLKNRAEFGETVRQRLPELQASMVSTDLVETTQELEATINTTSLLEGTIVEDTIRVDFSSPPEVEVTARQGTLPITESTLDSLLQTGGALVSRQASVDDRIANLREHIRDVQTSADRLQKLAVNNPAFDSVASRELVADIQVARRQLEQSVHELQHVHGLAAHAGTAIHRSLVQARLKTVDSLLPRLQAALDDALTVCDRQGSLFLTGGELPVSAAILSSIAPILEQLIRNAVAHGIDTPAVRQTEQKPVDGEIALSVRVDGLDLLIDVSDDGDGVDEDALNQQREEQGLAPIRNAAHLREILCTPGYSTLTDANPVAGRGQGLALVLDGVEALGGEMELLNDPGEGLTVRLRVPQPMLVARSLVFGSGEGVHAIPVSYVSAVINYDNEAAHVEHQNLNWNVCSIQQLMGVVGMSEPAERCALVTVNSERLAIPIPNLEGYKELIVQPLGAQLQSLERYVGGAVLSDGRQALILNLHRLIQIQLATRPTNSSIASPQANTGPPVALIADDSVTMRVAGVRLLQRLGFHVHSARDGLEALDFLNRSLPDVLLLDIEMPGADGFDVVRRVQTELVAAQVPVIMISTRRGPLERERARSLGVRHLIHKPYTETQLREALEEVGVLTSTEMGF